MSRVIFNSVLNIGSGYKSLRQYYKTDRYDLKVLRTGPKCAHFEKQEALLSCNEKCLRCGNNELRSSVDKTYMKYKTPGIPQVMKHLKETLIKE